MLHEDKGGLVGMLQSVERYFKGSTVHEVDIPNHNIIDRDTFAALAIAIGLILGVVAYVRYTPTRSIQRRPVVDADAVAHMKRQLPSQWTYQEDTVQ